MKTRIIISILTAFSLLTACSDDDNACIPACGGLQCGPDGCGGSCGSCADGTICINGTCSPNSSLCTPVCSGKQCGSDGCGGSCGVCAAGYTCNQNGQCLPAQGCVPNCSQKQCGPDGCGGSCGSCSTGYICGQNGQCVSAQGCVPNCSRKQCGPDGCGSVCGYCSAGFTCSEISGQCIPQECIPQCTGKQCGDDGCGSVCGYCPTNTICSSSGHCTTESGTCVPNCNGKECGDNGCGGSCGTCSEGFTCNAYGQCILNECTPNCNGKECGDNGCGGSCGTCSEGFTCNTYGQCILNGCTPNCAGKQCGPNGCGGSCGTCSEGYTCTDAGTCICVPYCQDRVCGNDGCGGSCGTCPQKMGCNESTGTCMEYGITAKIILEIKTVRFDPKTQFPRLDQIADIPGGDLPITVYDALGNVLGETTTDEKGEFHIELNRLPHSSDIISIVPAWYVNDEPKLAVFVANTGNKIPYDLWEWNIKLKNYAKNQDYSHLNDIKITIEQNSGGLYLYQTLVRAYQDIVAHNYGKALEKIPSMGVLWKPGLYFPCGSCFLNQMTQGLEIGNHTMKKTMMISARSTDESAWGYPTTLHEFGHFTLFQIKDSSRGGLHYINYASEPKLAWSEGYATFFSLMAMSWRAKAPITKYWRISDTSAYWLDYAYLFDEKKRGTLEVTKPDPKSEDGMKQDLSEAWISYILWKMFDGKEIPEVVTPSDGIAIGSEGIFGAIQSDRYKSYYNYNYHADDLSNSGYRTADGVDFVDFIDSAICRSFNAGKDDEARAIMDLVIQNDFPYDRSPVCQIKPQTP